ncbi:PxKF domain-containing protein [Georgenia daeguensis]|uniref:Ig-like domain-containing protein n=1 Tax=Georgenia daeguensis TaxID=908355 RepID=A0ABP8ER27_9MICO
MRRTRRLVAAAAAVPLLLGWMAGSAMADDIFNSLDASIDATAETMALNVGRVNGTTALYVKPANGDGKNGCNLSGSTTLSLDVTSSDAAVATVLPGSVTFTNCDDSKTLTVTPIAAGTATISVRQVSNSTGGTFNLAPATFTVQVAPPANTAPQIVIEGVTGGASYAKGAVPAATCMVTDAEDGVTTFAATVSDVSGPHSADGIGEQTASCSYTDAGGLKVVASETYGIVDPSAPVITAVLSPAEPDGNEGWYTGDVSVTWQVDEPESPSSLELTGCEPQEITSDQAATDYTCAATSAGGKAELQTVSIKRDATGPVITLSDVSGTQGQNGWYTSDVTGTFTATDALSGPATTSQAATTSGEGEVVLTSPAFSDVAGNTTPLGAVTQTYNVDKTAPATPTFIGGPTGDYYYGTGPDAPTCTATDEVSGLASCDISGGGTSVGTHTYTATAKDNAGHTSTATLTYDVLAWNLKGFTSPVNMGGVWNTVKGGSTVPLKFEVFAATELTSTSVVKSFTQKTVGCPGSSATVDEIELVTTGGTSLRYDATAGQFVQNWQTPKKPGTCYVVTMTTQDGSAITANFQLK